MTKHLLQNLWILLLALLTLGLAFLLVLDMIPAGSSGLEVKERVEVSSSLISADGNAHVSSVQGFLRNKTGESIAVEKITVVVADADGNTKTLELDGAKVLPHGELEISHVWESGLDFDRVSSVTVTVNGEEDLIPNAVRTFFLSASTVVYLVLTGISACFLIWVCKVRYYMYQEDMEKKKSQKA
jgi:hypothetical protein